MNRGFDLEGHYARCVSALLNTGVVKLLPFAGKLGVTGIDDQEYPLPTFDELEKVFNGNRDLVSRKMEQGFDRLELVPFAMPTHALIDRLSEQIVKHSATGDIFQTKSQPSDEARRVRVNHEKHVWTWSYLLEAIDSDQLIYFPKNFTSNHNGKWKLQVMQDPDICSFPGWSIGLLESKPVVSKPGQAKVLFRRKELECGYSPNEYLSIIKTPAYFGETGRTIEDFIISFLTHLDETNEVSNDIDDSNASWLIGQYMKIPYADLVPTGRWHRQLGRVRLDMHRSNNRVCTRNFGASTTVRLPRA